MSISKPLTSFGPAGSKIDVREAGENIMKTFCHNYPDTETHSIIPNLFGGKITELMDARPNLTRREENQLSGRMINQVGEGHENTVFNLFVRLIRQANISPTLLVMRTFEMDTKNALGLKRMALMSQLPKLNLESVNTAAENDFVVLVKNYGVVFVEVKGSTRDDMIRTAERQLGNVNAMSQRILKAITDSPERIIPTIKIIIVPDCIDPSPKEKTPEGSYFLFKDACENFREKWLELVNELCRQKNSNPFTPDEFREFSQNLVGIWSAKVVCVTEECARKYELKQDETDFSYVAQLKSIDLVVDTGNVRDERQFKFVGDKLNPFTNIVRTNDMDIFRSCDNIKLCYLTPVQKEIFTLYKHVIVRGSAGCGKSFLIIFKILEILNSLEPSSSILVLAPAPHNVRISNFLQSNNLSVDMISQFPPVLSSTNIFVMDIEHFFNVESGTLMGYDLKNYHLFVDDIQHMKLNSSFSDDDGTTFYDVGDFIAQTHNDDEHLYRWFMTDVVQGTMGAGRGYGKFSGDLFFTRDSERRTYTLPIIPLSHTMRNTKDIMKLTNEARYWIVQTLNASTYTLPSPQVGHMVSSRVPVYHKLQKDVDKRHILPFILKHVLEELKAVTKPPFSLQFSSIAIIWNRKKVFSKHKEFLTTFLATQFDTTPQTIEDQLISNNKNDIIVDVMQNTMSFEAPAVIFIYTGSGGGYEAVHYYRIGTRARVSLTVIDVDTSSGPAYFKNMDTVLWKPDDNNTFMKYNCDGD